MTIKRKNNSKFKSKTLSKSNKVSSSRRRLIKSRKSGTKTRKMCGGVKTQPYTNKSKSDTQEKMLGTYREVAKFLSEISTTSGIKRLDKIKKSPKYSDILNITSDESKNSKEKLEQVKKLLKNMFDSDLKIHAVADYLINLDNPILNTPITPMKRKSKKPTPTYENVMPIVPIYENVMPIDPIYENVMPKWQNKSNNPAIYESFEDLNQNKSLASSGYINWVPKIPKKNSQPKRSILKRRNQPSSFNVGHPMREIRLTANGNNYTSDFTGLTREQAKYVEKRRKEALKREKNLAEPRVISKKRDPKVRFTNLESDFSELDKIQNDKHYRNFYQLIMNAGSTTEFTIKGVTIKLYLTKLDPKLKHPGYYNENKIWITNETIPFQTNNNKREYDTSFNTREESFLDKGAFKSGYKVEIINHKELGLPKYGALTHFNMVNGKEHLDKIIPLQEIAAENNLATMPYAYDYIPNYGCFILMELVDGIDLCKFNTNDMLTDDIQIEIFYAVLKLIKLNITLPDKNCGNIFIDIQDDKIKITFIDDFMEGDGAKNKIHNIINTLLVLNNLQFKIIDCNIKNYITYFFTINEINIDNYPNIYPKGEVIIYPTEPIIFCDKMNNAIKKYLHN